MARTAISSVPHGVRLGPASQQQSPDEVRAAWGEAFRRVRAETEARAAPLSPEDQQIQSMADASPAKWHRAHVTWFFEQFLLQAARSRLQDFRRTLSLPVQFLLRRRRPAPRAAHSAG